jgi:hypothetical protein
MNKVNIRVYKRGYKGTILIWNTDPLTEEQRKNAKVFVRPEGCNDWMEPQTGMPDTIRMGKIMDGKTDTITVVHDDNFTAETPFAVKIDFGDMTAELEVEPKNQHKAYVKTERYQLENGQFIYADPAYVIGFHPVVTEQLRRLISEELHKVKT